MGSLYVPTGIFYIKEGMQFAAQWKEVNQKLSAENFTNHNMPDRVKRKATLWKGLLDKKL
jgi:hypothetical protein